MYLQEVHCNLPWKKHFLLTTVVLSHRELQKKFSMIHDEAKEEIMQKGNSLNQEGMKLHFQRAAWLLLQIYQHFTEWLKVKEYPQTQRLKGCLCETISKPRLRYCLLLKVAATSCWITQESLNEEGAHTPRGMERQKYNLCQDTKTQGRQQNPALRAKQDQWNKSASHH